VDAKGVSTAFRTELCDPRRQWLGEHGDHEGVPLDDGGFLVVGGFGGDVSAETYRVGGDH
jgi:hypothetical protein